MRDATSHNAASESASETANQYAKTGVPASPSAATPAEALPHAPNWPLLALWRFVLAFVVFAAHLQRPFPEHNPLQLIRELGAFTAVLAFFLLSGFSIRHSLAREKKGFYGRRARRIIPALFAAQIIAGTAFVIGGPVLTLPDGFSTELPDAQGFAGLSQFFVHTLPLQTVFIKRPTWNGPAWSLGIEAFFYLLAPFFVRLSRRLLWSLIFLSGAVFILANQPNFEIATQVGWLPAAALLWAWLLGFMLPDIRPGTLAQNLFLILPLFLFNFHVQERGSYQVLTVTITMLILLQQGTPRLQIPKRFKKIANWLGSYSYTLYICHWPLLFLFTLWHLTTFVGIVIGIPIACALVHALLDGALYLHDRLNRKEKLSIKAGAPT